MGHSEYHAASSEETPVTRTLGNGVRVCIEPFDGVQSFSLCLRLCAGAAQDPPESLGLANVMETAMMKGTRQRDAAALFDAFDALGAERSSSAGAESIAFAAGLLPAHVAGALELYREVLESAAFPDSEVDLAKRLALEDILSLEDQPERKVVHLIRKAALGDPLGRPIQGTRESVATIQRRDVVECFGRTAHPGNLIITAAGGMEAEAFFDAVEAAFGDWSGQGSPPPPSRPEIASGITHEFKESEQAHIAIMYPGASRGTEDYYPAMIASAVLSQGGSCRLFTEVREKRALVYHVGTTYSPFRAGAVTVLYAGTRADRVDETLEVCLAEVERLAEDITREELDRAASVVLGRIHTVGRLAASRASALSVDLFLEGRPRSISEVVDSLRSVSLEQALNAAKRYAPHPRAVAVLGPKRPERLV